MAPASVLLALIVGSIYVEVPDSSLDCGLQDVTVRALRLVLPGIDVLREIDESVPHWTVSIVVDHSRMRLVLTDDQRETHFVRRLALRTSSCSVLADSVAVIVERYLRDIGWEPQSHTLPPLPSPPAAARPVQSEQAATEAAPVLLDTPRTSWRLAGGAQVEVGDARARRRYGATAQAETPLGFGYALIEAGGLAPTRLPVLDLDDRVGTYAVWSVFVLAGVGACWADEGRRGCVDIKGGIESFFGTVGGAGIRDRADKWFARPLMAVDLRWLEPLGPIPLTGVVSIGCFALVNPGEFAVEGAQTSFTPPAYGARASVGVMVPN